MPCCSMARPHEFHWFNAGTPWIHPSPSSPSTLSAWELSAPLRARDLDVTGDELVSRLRAVARYDTQNLSPRRMAFLPPTQLASPSSQPLDDRGAPLGAVVGKCSETRSLHGMGCWSVPTVHQCSLLLRWFQGESLLHSMQRLPWRQHHKRPDLRQRHRRSGRRRRARRQGETPRRYQLGVPPHRPAGAPELLCSRSHPYRHYRPEGGPESRRAPPPQCLPRRLSLCWEVRSARTLQGRK